MNDVHAINQLLLIKQAERTTIKSRRSSRKNNHKIKKKEQKERLMASSSSSRWCPTQEQVMILEEIYNKGGIKTPNAFQIQQITTHLSFYGKIEGKNVFYWFQNHKARERQKLRRKLMHNQKQLHLGLHQHHPCWYHCSPPSAALTSLHQGGRGKAEAAGAQDNLRAPQPTIWPDIDAWVQRSFHHDRFLKDKLSPLCSTGQPPLKTLELFPLKSTHLNNNVIANVDQTSSSLSSY